MLGVDGLCSYSSAFSKEQRQLTSPSRIGEQFGTFCTPYGRQATINMSNFEIAMSAWLGVLSSYGCELSHFMNPGASANRIAEIEASIGYEFTDDLKQLYLWADGQEKYMNKDKMTIVHYDDGGADAVYDVDPSPGKFLCPLFGHYFFDNLNDSLVSYQRWLRGIAKISDEHNRALVTVRAGHAIHRQYFRKGWFPISNNSGGDSLAIDFDPPKDGTYGQVIIIGPNEDERRVVASSITELLTMAASCSSLQTEFMKTRSQPIPIFMDFDMECW